MHAANPLPQPRWQFGHGLNALLLVSVAGLATLADAAENWPQWRGPSGDSVSNETNLPVTWSESERVVWKCPLPEWGTSTPAIWGNAIFVTTQQEEKLLLLRIDAHRGDVMWTREVGSGTFVRTGGRKQTKFHELHNMASPSPVTDGELVVAHFGNGDLAVYDFAGKQLWKRNLQEDYGAYTIWWGHANSPVLVGDLLISVCMQDSLADLQASPSPSYLVAHDKRTGREVWKQPRMTDAKSEECDSYTTPLLHHGPHGDELIVMGGNQIDAYDPANGAQRWLLAGIPGGRTITGPTIAPNLLGRGVVFTTQGMRGPLLAIRLGQQGALSGATDVLWQDRQGTPDTCCPVVWDDLLFTVSDNGVAVCYDAATGKRHWQQRLGGDFKASPLAAAGRIYFVAKDGLTTVVAAKSQYEKLAANQLDDEILASPAVSAGRIYLRGRKHLYCVGDR